MKHCQQVVLGAWLLGLVPFAAFAVGAGHLALHSDEQGTSCSIANPAPATVVTVYVFHEFGIPGETANGVRFHLEAPTGWSIIGFIATPGYETIGDVRTDLTVFTGACANTTVRIGSVLNFGSSTTPACSQYQILAAPGFPSVLAQDCSFVEHNIVGEGALVNPDASCCCQCLPTEQSTWGQVKGLYR